MKPSEYIIQELNKFKNFKKQNIKKPEDIAGFIYKSLVSKKFRKYSLTPGYEQHILSAIKTNIAKNEPIKLVLVFGGYKLWRLEESPEVDWAELFSLIYYIKWMKPILAVHTPGVWFDFFSDSGIVEQMDNIPKEDTERYSQSFRKLLEFIKPYIPENLNFTFNTIVDQYKSPIDFQKDLEKSINETKDELKNISLTLEQIKTIELNVKLKDGQDEDPMWCEKVNLIHEAYTRISKRRPYYRTPEKIMVCTRPVKNCIAVGTTKRSVVKFWVGIGVLKKIGDEFIEYVFSPSQIEKAKLVKEDISISGLEGKNFKTIRILNE